MKNGFSGRSVGIIFMLCAVYGTAFQMFLRRLEYLDK